MVPGGLLSPLAFDLDLHCGLEVGLTTKPCVTLANDRSPRSYRALFSQCVSAYIRLYFSLPPIHPHT